MAAVTVGIYLATPIDQAQGGLDRPWNRVVRAAPVEASTCPGVVVYHPARAFSVGPDNLPGGTIEAINRAALAECQALVAVLPAGVPTVGVPREIEAAVQLGLPVAVVTDLATVSWSLVDVDMFPLSLDGLRTALEWARDQALAGSNPGFAGWHIGERGVLPTRAHETDAGYDLYVSEATTVPPGAFVDVHTDVRVALPAFMWGRIVGRSSTLRRRNLLVVEGVIDPGYRGLLYSGVRNLGDKPVTVERGERLAQFIPHFNAAHGLAIPALTQAQFDALPHDGRGAAGFGSSGA